MTTSEARERWNETLAAVESAANGNVIAAETVHAWLQGWGTPGEAERPEPANRPWPDLRPLRCPDD